jgi:hypothetical protein
MAPLAGGAADCTLRGGNLRVRRRERLVNHRTENVLEQCCRGLSEIAQTLHDAQRTVQSVRQVHSNLDRHPW